MLIKRFKMKLGTKILCLVFVVILLFSASVGTVMLKENYRKHETNGN